MSRDNLVKKHTTIIHNCLINDDKYDLVITGDTKMHKKPSQNRPKMAQFLMDFEDQSLQLFQKIVKSCSARRKT